MAFILSDRERLAWLRLARTRNVGPVTFGQLIARFGSATASLTELPRLSRRGGGETLQPPAESESRKELEALHAIGGRVIASVEPDYPLGLAALDPPPPLISVLGHVVQFRREMIAIVGARNASALGRKLAGQLAADLGQAGLVVVSGLARGIDSTAHESTLESGTCAVVAGGIDIIYPPENAALYERIRAEGTIISEMPLGQSPQARHFPRRNRLISGLSRGIVVVEAAEGSGSLITATYALEQNREIFAVPGSPLDPRAKGTNRLIREGATLTESAEDVLAVLRPILGQHFREPDRTDPSAQTDSLWIEAEADRIRITVEEALGPAPVEVDALVRICQATHGSGFDGVIGDGARRTAVPSSWQSCVLGLSLPNRACLHQRQFKQMREQGLSLFQRQFPKGLNKIAGVGGGLCWRGWRNLRAGPIKT